MNNREPLITASAAALGICGVLALGSAAGRSQEVRGTRPVDANGAPVFRVDPFWPKPLPNRWSMQQVTGIGVDHMDHIWFVNRGAVAEGDEIGGGDNPPRIECCVRGPEIIELDRQARWSTRGAAPATIRSGRPRCRRSSLRGVYV